LTRPFATNSYYAASQPVNVFQKIGKPAVATKLVAMSMRSAGNSPYDPIASDLGFFFNQSNKSAFVKGHLDA
jgi:hypothetical protein